LNIVVVFFPFVSVIMKVYSTEFQACHHIVVFRVVGGFPTHDHRGVTIVHLVPFAPIFIDVTSQLATTSVSLAERLSVIGPLMLVAGPVILAVPG
jgi:hypothetical protein